MTGPITQWHICNWCPAIWTQKMVILKEIFGAVIWIVFNESWHSVACCQTWPMGKSLLVHFLSNWKWQDMLKAFFFLVCYKWKFQCKILMPRSIDLCAPRATGIAEWVGEQNLPCRNFTFASRRFWVMITSAACASRSLLTKNLLHIRDEEEMCFAQWRYAFREWCLDKVFRSGVC